MKDDFHRSKSLIPVANASTGDVNVTTPCSSCMMACMPSVTWFRDYSVYCVPVVRLVLGSLW